MSTSAPPTGLPVAAAPQRAPAAAGVDRDLYRRLAGRARLLSWVSLGYMTLEGAIAIVAGVLAGSVATCRAMPGSARAVTHRRSGACLVVASVGRPKEGGGAEHHQRDHRRGERAQRELPTSLRARLAVQQKADATRDHASTERQRRRTEG